MSEKIAHLNASNFNETIASATTPVLVDFWASWCSPCKAIAPALEQYANDLDGRVKIAKVNLEEEGADALAAKFGIQSIPALLVFKGGEVVDKTFGATEIMYNREKYKERLLSFA